MSKEVYRRLSKAERKLENTNRLRTNNSTLRIKYEGVKKLLEKKDKEIERLNNIINELKKENQELKKKYENAVADYEKTRFEKEQLNSLVNSCQEEIRQLKKQFEKLERGKWVKYSRKQIENKLIDDIDNVETLGDILNYLDSLYLSIDNQLYEIKIHKKQQKEFIKYLEKRYKDITDVIGSYGSNTDMLYGKKDMIREILQKYKELKGSDKE